MKNALFLLGYFSIAFFSLGLVFKLQHWPGAGIMLIIGGVLLNAVFLPLLLVSKMRKSEN